MKARTNAICIVCRVDKASARALPSGAVVDICAECLKSDFRVAEAERRAKEKTA